MFGLLVARAVASPLRDLSANAIGPTVVVIGVHVGLSPTLRAGGRATIVVGAVGGYMLVSTLGAANGVLAEGARTGRAVMAIVAAAAGCIVAGAIGLGLARLLS